MKKLIENVNNPYKIYMLIKEDSFVCKTCNFTFEQNLPEDKLLTNCPIQTCNFIAMERSGPYIFITSFEGLRTLCDLNVGGLLEAEALHFDFQPSRISQYTCLAAYAYDLDLRSMAPLFTAILTRETEMSVFITLENVRKMMWEKFEIMFNPSMYMADEAACLKNAVKREHGADKLRSYGTCELHYMKSAFQHCSGELGSQKKQFEHLKFAEGLLNASTPAVYEGIFHCYKMWIQERQGRIDSLMDWLIWWNERRSGWSNAFRDVQLPRTNLAEIGNSKFSQKSGMTKLSLDMAIKAIIVEHQEYAAKKIGVVNGDFIVGKGRSRLNMEDRQIKALFKRINEMPSNPTEQNIQIENIVGEILGCQVGYFTTVSDQGVVENQQLRDDAFEECVLNSNSIHRPPSKKLTPVKRKRNEGNLSNKRVRISLQVDKASLQGTLKGSKSVTSSALSTGEKMIRRAWSSFSQLANVVQIQLGLFKLTVMKAQKSSCYQVKIIGELSCTCPDFKRHNQKTLIDHVICKHFAYVLLVLGFDPSAHKEILTKSRSSDFTEEDMTEILSKCEAFHFNVKILEDIIKKLDKELNSVPKNNAVILPFIDERKLYGKYLNKTEAMDEILNTERFKVLWFATLAQDGRRQCPGEEEHQSRYLKKGQMCLVAYFNSIVTKTVDGKRIYRIKDQKRYFCLKESCYTIFAKTELRDFSNISQPTVVNVDYLNEASRYQFIESCPNLQVESTKN